jgi:hypothetical protein
MPIYIHHLQFYLSRDQSRNPLLSEYFQFRTSYCNLSKSRFLILSREHKCSLIELNWILATNFEWFLEIEWYRLKGAQRYTSTSVNVFVESKYSIENSQIFAHGGKEFEPNREGILCWNPSGFPVEDGVINDFEQMQKSWCPIYYRKNEGSRY